MGEMPAQNPGFFRRLARMTRDPGRARRRARQADCHIFV
jgi:hypothetical protein